MLSLLLMLIAVPKNVPVFGFDAVQCQQIRPVTCVVNEHMTKSDCDFDIGTAVTDINKLVGRKIFQYIGVIEVKQIRESLAKGIYVIGMDTIETTERHALGYTQYMVLKKNGINCIEQVVTILNVDLQGVEFWQVTHVTIMHEMLHALGANHASGEASAPSIMASSVSSPGFVSRPSENDIYSLRLVYGEVK